MTSISGLAEARSTGRNEGMQSRLCLRVDLEQRSPGIVELQPQADNIIKVHAGIPLYGACRLERFCYRAGDIDILPAGTAEHWEEFSPSTTLMIRLPPSALRQAAEQLGINARLTELDARFQLRDPQIEHIAWALNAERADGYPNGTIYSEILGTALAVHLCGRYAKPARLNGGLSKPHLRRVTEYIEANLDQDLSLARLAALTEMSVSHFGTLFKRSVGLPVHEYIIRRRVERAKVLLREGELPISRIALEAGFSHQSHMARCMRRVLGVSPSDVRAGTVVR